jgi:hypothetical protein
MCWSSQACISTTHVRLQSRRSWEGRHAKNTLFRPSKAPTRSTHTLVRDYSRSSRCSSSLGIGFPLSSMQGENNITTTSIRLSLLTSRLSYPGRLPSVYGTGRSVQYRPRLVDYAARGAPTRAMCFYDNPSTPPKALMLMMGTDERRGWVEKSYMVGMCRVRTFKPKLSVLSISGGG